MRCLMLVRHVSANAFSFFCVAGGGVFVVVVVVAGAAGLDEA